nr:MAG TPA: BppU domain protein [Caudoviricetes sp.]
MTYRHLIVDNNCDNKITEIITQKEHGVTLFEIECKNNGYDVDLTECTQAQFYGDKPDGHKVGVKCSFNENKTAVLLPLILQMTTAKGLLNGVLELSFEGGNIRFSGINFKVLPAPDDVEVESKDEFTIFENCLFKPEQDGKIGQVLTLGSDGENVWSDIQGGSSDYNDLENKPSINGVELNGNKSLADLHIKQNYTADDIHFVDGMSFQEKYDKGELKGQKGEQGLQGEKGEKGDQGERGQDGTNGVDGINGKDGTGITKSEIVNGELVVTYSDGNSANLGKVVGENGQKGQDGVDGRTPEKGVDYFTDEDKTNFTAKITNNLEPMFNQKQDILVSGENIKTVNGSSILGSGDIEIGGSESKSTVFYNIVTEEEVTKIRFPIQTNIHSTIKIFVYIPAKYENKTQLVVAKDGTGFSPIIELAPANVHNPVYFYVEIPIVDIVNGIFYSAPFTRIQKHGLSSNITTPISCSCRINPNIALQTTNGTNFPVGTHIYCVEEKIS